MASTAAEAAARMADFMDGPQKEISLGQIAPERPNLSVKIYLHNEIGWPARGQVGA
jgi:hypothetical protein